MAIEFKLPDIGEGIAEGEIVKWLVKPGDEVKEHQSVVEVMTDKATVEIPAPASGKITSINAKEGDTVPVGSVLFVLETGAGAATSPARAANSPPSARDASSTTARDGSSGGSRPSESTARPAGAGSRSADPGRAPSRDAQAPRAPSTRDAEISRGTQPARPTQPARAEQPRPSAQPAANANAADRGARSTAPGSAPTSPSAASATAGGATIDFKLPDIGEGIAEGEIVKWLVKPGDVVKEHQSIVEVMTDKATVEIPAPAAGTITALLAKDGDVVPVGSVIFKLATNATGAPARTAASAEVETTRTAERAPARSTESAPSRAPEREPAPARANEREPAPTRSTEREPAMAGAASNASEARARSTAAPRDGAPAVARERVLAVPSARRVARDMGVDLALVQGTGRNGVVRRADVEDFLNRGAPSAEPAREAAPAPTPRAQPAPVSVPPGAREKRIPFRGVRRKIAEAMVRSKFTAPHFTVVEEVDVTDLVRLREKAKAIGEAEGVKITYMPFIMKATAIALAKHPTLNGRLDEAAQELVHYEYVNLGIAMDTEQGLIVPVVKDVQAKGLLELGRELSELAERTRAGKVRPDDLRGSTFSITNAGNIGGVLATPIINFPDIGILGVHRIVKRPGVVETPDGDRIEVRQYMNFSCSVDHRLADGADAARFLVYLKRLLENPGLLAL